MYHTLVKRLAARNFDLVNTKGYTELLASCVPDVSHRFGGDHALGGQRHTREALGKWLVRLGRLVPTLQLTITDMWVKGWPWSTTSIDANGDSQAVTELLGALSATGVDEATATPIVERASAWHSLSIPASYNPSASKPIN